MTLLVDPSRALNVRNRQTSVKAWGSILSLRHMRTLHVKKGNIMQAYGDNFIPFISVENEMLHLSDSPFCWDRTCPCHEDQDHITLVAQQVQDGLFTPDEATNFVNGKTI